MQVKSTSISMYTWLDLSPVSTSTMSAYGFKRQMMIHSSHWSSAMTSQGRIVCVCCQRGHRETTSKTRGCACWMVRCSRTRETARSSSPRLLRPQVSYTTLVCSRTVLFMNAFISKTVLAKNGVIVKFVFLFSQKKN